MNGSPFGRDDTRGQTRTVDLERRTRALENMRASDVPIDPIATLGTAADVQAALETLAGLGAAIAAGGSYIDDAAAAVGGVAVGHFYRNGSVVMVRVA